jgi:hypothetical protein
MPNHYQLSSITYPPSKRDGEWANQQENNKQQQQNIRNEGEWEEFQSGSNKNKQNKKSNTHKSTLVIYLISFSQSLCYESHSDDQLVFTPSNEKKKIKIFLNAPTGYYLIL